MNEFLMQFFTTGHLDSELAAVSQRFGDVARWVVETLPRNAERTTALRKLLEGKDAAVRTIIAARNEAAAAAPAPVVVEEQPVQMRTAATDQLLFTVAFKTRVRGSVQWSEDSERIAADSADAAEKIVVGTCDRNNFDCEIISVEPLYETPTT